LLAHDPITNTAWVRARLCKLQKGSPIRRGFAPGFVNYKKGATAWVRARLCKLQKGCTRLAWVCTRLCKLQKRVHSTRMGSCPAL